MNVPGYRLWDHYVWDDRVDFWAQVTDRKNIAVIVDSDSIVYPIAFSAAAKAGKDAALAAARNVFMERVTKVTQGIKSLTDAAVVQFFTMPSNGAPKYRDQFINKVKYKENRKTAAVQPLWVEEIQHELITLSNSVFCHPAIGEADDYISILASIVGESFGTTNAIVIGDDKDLNNIPCLRFTSKHGNFINTTTDANRHFYKQCLMGDAADNIKALPGIGAAKANAILRGLSTKTELYEATLRAYLDAFEGDTDEATNYLYETANLLYLRKDFDDFWSPPE